jgi:photosystem II stability/assembly factor-like uncharacterized protein
MALYERFRSLFAYSPAGPVQFLTPEQGLTLSNGRLFLSSDEGRTWALVKGAEGLPELNCLFFTSRDRGWVGGSFSRKLYCTTDSGANWRTVDIGQSDTVTDIYFADQAHGWCSTAEGFVLATTDCGESWHRMLLRRGTHLFGVRFAGLECGYALGLELNPPAELVAIAAYQRWEQNGRRDGRSLDDWLAAEEELSAGTVVFVTRDAGETWQEIHASHEVGYNSLSVPASDTCCIGGEAVLVIRQHGDSQVKQLTNFSDGPEINRVVAFASSTLGCSGTDLTASPRLNITTDGGKTWSKVALPGGFNGIASIFYLNLQLAWAACGNYAATSTIIASRDGGQNWEVRCSAL